MQGRRLGGILGILVNLASDTNYITYKAADRLRFKSEKITLVVDGVGGMTIKVNTERYLLGVRVKIPKGTERAHELSAMAWMKSPKCTRQLNRRSYRNSSQRSSSTHQLSPLPGPTL